MTAFELKVLKRNNAFMVTIIILLLGSMGSGFWMFLNHGERIKENTTINNVQSTAIKNLLNASGTELVVRSVAKEMDDEIVLHFNTELDKKLDKNVGDIILKSLDRIESKIDDKNSP